MGGKRKPAKPNPFRIEYEEAGGQTFPTTVFFSRKPVAEELAAFCREHPLMTVSARPLDSAGCAYQLTQVPAPESTPLKLVLTPRKLEAVGSPGDPSVLPAHEPSFMRGRIGVSLRQSTLKLLTAKAKSLGVTPTTMARIFIQQGVGELGGGDE